MSSSPTHLSHRKCFTFIRRLHTAIIKELCITERDVFLETKRFLPPPTIGQKRLPDTVQDVPIIFQRHFKKAESNYFLTHISPNLYMHISLISSLPSEIFVFLNIYRMSCIHQLNKLQCFNN